MSQLITNHYHSTDHSLMHGPGMIYVGKSERIVGDVMTTYGVVAIGNNLVEKVLLIEDSEFFSCYCCHDFIYVVGKIKSKIDNSIDAVLFKLSHTLEIIREKRYSSGNVNVLREITFNDKNLHCKGSSLLNNEMMPISLVFDIDTNILKRSFSHSTDEICQSEPFFMEE